MASKRVSTLTLLSRLKQNEVDQYASQLGTIRSRIQSIETQLQELQDRLNSEGQTFQPEYIAYLGNFLKAIEFRRSVFVAQKDGLERDAAKLEEALLRLFSEAQVRKTALKDLVKQEEAQENAREVAYLDELALIAHRRADYP